MMGGAARSFSENYALTSLAPAFGVAVRPFTVTRWLRSGDVVELGRGPDDPFRLEVLETPGHTTDSISLVARWDGRIFCGDLLYPYTAIHVDVLGSNTLQYLASVRALLALATEHNAKHAKVAEFCTTLGLDGGGNRLAEACSLIEVCDGNV
jgi:glyoxylase-like metal-dependent hydrolase (beta-lactamase superfamily II)